MKPCHQQSAFSLIEVLFALLVLTMGFVFVASQFPIALNNAKTVAEDTVATINAHNTSIMNNIQMKSINDNAVNFIGTDAFPNFYFINNGNTLVNPYYLANMRVIYPIDGHDIVMDDPCNTYFQNWPSLPQNNQYPYTLPPLYTHTPSTLNELPPQVSYYEPGTTGFASVEAVNIGKRVCPPVTKYDNNVLDIMLQKHSLSPPFNITNPTIWKYWEDAVLEVVTTKRKLCTVSLYQCIIPQSNSYRFFLFNCHFDINRYRYPIQDVFSMTPDIPTALPASEDRLLPVPWRVALKNAISPSVRYAYPKSLEVIDLTDSNDGSANNYSDYALIIVELLRKGSWIINANTGETYEMLEVYNTGFRLKNPMQLNDNPLSNFWVIPPAINSDRTFADTQPVIDVTEKVIQF